MGKNNKYKKIQCINCGILGHTHRICNEPKMSYGIIAIHIDPHYIELKNKISKMLSTITKISDVNVLIDEEDLKKLPEIKNYVKILMIMRRHTIGYSEFVRGKYKINDIQQISFLFRQMIPDEVKLISQNLDHFDVLWKYLWHLPDSFSIDNYSEQKPNSPENRNYNRDIDDYKNSESKFNIIKNSKLINLANIIKLTRIHAQTQEWCIPKGRRICGESDVQTAIREFSEETGFTRNDFTLYENIRSSEEILDGTDGIKYSYHYYIAMLNSDRVPTCDNLQRKQLCEVGAIGLFDFDEALHKIMISSNDQIFDSRIKIISMLHKNILKMCFEK